MSIRTTNCKNLWALLITKFVHLCLISAHTSITLKPRKCRISVCPGKLKTILLKVIMIDSKLISRHNNLPTNTNSTLTDIAKRREVHRLSHNFNSPKSIIIFREIMLNLNNTFIRRTKSTNKVSLLDFYWWNSILRIMT